MSTEVKIGLVFVLALLLLVVGWMVLMGDDPAATGPQRVDTASDESQDLTNLPITDADERERAAAESGAASPVTGDSTSIIIPTRSPSAGVNGGSLVLKPTSAENATVTGPGSALPTTPTLVLTDDDSYLAVPVVVPGTPTGNNSEYYTVRDGDGYWRIAEKVYGDGLKYTVLQAANPKYTNSDLKPGMRIVVPPLAGVTSKRPSTSGVIMQAGGTVYVVTIADTTGYWGIAKKVYGAGKYNELIAKANPGVDSKKLRPGRKLVIPPLPTGRLKVTTVAAKTTFTPEKGGTYLVVKDDSYWKIAKKLYRKGDLNHLIIAANPKITPPDLKPGQVLKIPPMPTATRLSRGPATASRLPSGGRLPSDDKPIFD